MSLFARKTEQRNISYQQIWASGGVWPPQGASMSVVNALGVSSVFACVDLIASSVAAMPLHAYRDASDGTAQKLSPLPSLLRSPSAVFSLDEWIYMGVASMLLWGNAYGHIVEIGPDGWPTTIEWLDPRRMNVSNQDGVPAYLYGTVPIPRDRLVHIRHGMLLPGEVVGASPIQKLPMQLRTGIEAAKYEMSWFTDGAHPSSVLQSDQTISQEQARTIKDRVLDALRGRREPLVLGAGVKWTQVQMAPHEAALIEVKTVIATEVANAYHVPPEYVGGTSGHSMTYTNLEAAQQNLDVRALLPVYTRFERALTTQMPRPQYAHFNADALIRTQLLERYKANGLAIRDGWKSPNEVRGIEKLSPIPDGDHTLWPPYFTGAGTIEPPQGSGYDGNDLGTEGATSGEGSTTNQG